MSVAIALYRGRQSGRLGPRLLAWWQRCDYSHCAVLWQFNGPAAHISDASLLKGVASHWVRWHPDLWEVWELDADRAAVAAWWQAHTGQRYDWLGLLGFVLRRIKGWLRAWWCSEAVMASLGMPDPWRWDVGLLAVYLRKHGRRVH